MSEADDRALLEAHEPRQTFPFLVGAYLATNAIQDAYLVVDSPDCAFFKAEHVHGTHDLTSTLLDASGHHRIINTRADIGNIVDDRRKVVTEIVEEVYRDPRTGLVAVSSMPMATVTGVEYGLLVRDVMQRVGGGKPALEIPGASLHQDWLDGYAALLAELAAALPLADVPRVDGSVAIVGYLMDRMEADHAANVAELRRLLEALGLEVCSIWLDGSPTAGLAKIASASTILSLPYGREAARILGERTGARLLELELPFGLESTERFVDTLAQAFDRGPQRQALRERELPRIARALEFVIPHLLLGRRFAFCGEPFHARAVAALAREVGAEVVSFLVMASESHLDLASLGVPRERVIYEPGITQIIRFLERDFTGPDAAHLLITNGKLVDLVGDRDLPFLEHGYPSYFTHAIFDTPYLGYRGFLSFVDRLANRLALCEAMGVGARHR